MTKIFGLISTVIVLCVAPTYATINVSQRWDKTYNTSGFTLAYSVQQTLDGGYILSGSTFGSFGFPAFLVLKLDYNGDIMWQKTYGGDGGDKAISIQQTFDGGYIVAGWSYSYPVGFLVLKLDNSGNIAWEKSYTTVVDPHQGGDAIYNVSIMQTQDAGFIMAGGKAIGSSGGEAIVSSLFISCGFTPIRSLSNILREGLFLSE